MKTVNYIAQLLMVIGAINWGLVGLFGFDLVAAIFGAGSGLSDVVYTLVGVAGLFGISFLIPQKSEGGSQGSASSNM
jgi:hypothetical protein